MFPHTPHTFYCALVCKMVFNMYYYLIRDKEKLSHHVSFTKTLCAAQQFHTMCKVQHWYICKTSLKTLLKGGANKLLSYQASHGLLLHKTQEVCSVMIVEIDMNTQRSIVVFRYSFICVPSDEF